MVKMIQIHQKTTKNFLKTFVLGFLIRKEWEKKKAIQLQ